MILIYQEIKDKEPFDLFTRYKIMLNANANFT